MSDLDVYRKRMGLWGRKRAEALAEADESSRHLQRAVRGAIDAGMSESEAARVAQVSRLTVRSWLGK